MTSEIESFETALLSSEVRRSRRALTEIIAEEFIEFGASGRRFTKSDILDALPMAPECTFSISGFSERELSPDTVLATYELAASNGTRTLRSSIWRRNGENWQIVFHQGTAIK